MYLMSPSSVLNSVFISCNKGKPYLSRSYKVCEMRTMTSTPASVASFLIAASRSFPKGSESYSMESLVMLHS